MRFRNPFSARRVAATPAPQDDFQSGMAHARALAEQGLAQEAALVLDGLLARHGQDFDALYLLGNVCDEMARTEQAHQAFTQALDIEPNHVAALCCAALDARTLGRAAEAQALLEHAVRIAPESPHARFNRGLVRLDQKRDADAAADFAAARALARGHPWGAGNPVPPGAPAGIDPQSTDWQCARFKLIHDIEQMEYLRRLGKLHREFDAVLDEYRRALEDPGLPVEPYQRAPLDPGRYPLLAATWKRPVHAPDPDPPAGGMVSANLPWTEIEAHYLAADPNLAWIDGLLTAQGLAALRGWCLESTVWNDLKAGYLGAYMHDGFASRLMLQLVAELRQRMPRVIGNLPLQTMWAYKYDSQQAGIGLHADEAAVNVNFWITPDGANLDSSCGGLVVHTRDAPDGWGFRRFNSDPEAIRHYLQSEGGAAVRVPYRENRAVLFDSDLFHETDHFHFKSGYENRRINITLLFGSRGRSAPRISSADSRPAS
jgi:tetratricopeptide (TPR) repeat protein